MTNLKEQIEKLADAECESMRFEHQPSFVRGATFGCTKTIELLSQSEGLKPYDLDKWEVDLEKYFFDVAGEQIKPPELSKTFRPKIVYFKSQADLALAASQAKAQELETSVTAWKDRDLVNQEAIEKRNSKIQSLESQLAHTIKNRDTAIEYNNQLADNAKIQIDELTNKLTTSEQNQAEALKVIENLYTKTNVYEELYDGDKELKTYRLVAREYINKVKGVNP